MWLPKKLALASTITLFLFKNPLFAPAQQKSPPAKAAPGASGQTTAVNPADSVAAAASVITVHGVCTESAEKATKDSASCSTVITREQFEALINVLNPGGQPLPPNGRQNLARSYAEFLALEAAARRSGLENTPQFRDLMNWVRLRTIADFYRRDLQEKYRAPTQEEIDAYYKQHLEDFKTVKLARILVPRDDVSARDKEQFEKKAFQAANDAHDRAAKGNDLSQIQKDVYATLGLTSPPATDMGTFRRANLGEKESADVFALKPGEVTQVELDPRSYVIYKVAAKDTLPEDQVKAEIAREISQQKFKDAIKAATDAAQPEFNEQYFGAGILKPPLKAPALPPREPAH